MLEFSYNERDDGTTRGEPEIERTQETHTIGHTFDWTSLDDVEYSNVSTFYVRDDVAEIVIYFKAAFSGSEITGHSIAMGFLVDT